MASHLHKQIRDALVTKLTGLTTSGSRVYANRLQPLPDALSPTLRVFLDREQASTLSVHTSPLTDRVLDVLIECCAKAVSSLDDTVDQMSKEVEIALAAGITVGSATLVPEYQGMEFEDVQSDKPVGIKRMSYRITYTAAANAPDVLS